jgi:FkbM family methyltransferase|uniref:FkbM family methyltransferase n=1 Tax=Desulfobacca acetoxidans TaxID=60893 RepID=A0A7C3SHQ9_9BACT
MLEVFFRELLRWYLREFPLRDGKILLYHLFNRRLAPACEEVEVKIKLGFKLLLDLKEPSQRMIYFFGNYDERHEISLINRLLRRGDIFWDIGANIGFYTLAASTLVGSAGLVVAFEPGPRSWDALVTNIKLNHKGNIRPFKLAVTDAYGWVTLYSRPDIADGGASILPSGDQCLQPYQVQAVNLDRFQGEMGLAAPTFMKIDVEGAEPQVLAGAKNILSADHPPLLLIEMNDKAAIGGMLQEMGFVGAHLHRRGWYECRDLEEAKSRNMLWFHPDCNSHRQRLKKVLRVIK